MFEWIQVLNNVLSISVGYIFYVLKIRTCYGQSEKHTWSLRLLNEWICYYFVPASDNIPFTCLTTRVIEISRFFFGFNLVLVPFLFSYYFSCRECFLRSARKKIQRHTLQHLLINKGCSSSLFNKCCLNCQCVTWHAESRGGGYSLIRA